MEKIWDIEDDNYHFEAKDVIKCGKIKVVCKKFHCILHENVMLECKSEHDELRLLTIDGKELIKNSKGVVKECTIYRYNYANVYKYKDDDGWHMFAIDGTRLTKDAEGEVLECGFEKDGKWKYMTDELKIYEGVYEPVRIREPYKKSPYNPYI